jgi:hypothetical protein
MAHGPLIVTFSKLGVGHLCEIVKWLTKICDICPDMGVGYYAAMGHFAAEYGLRNCIILICSIIFNYLSSNRHAMAANDTEF